jgi:hypothetical protein
MALNDKQKRRLVALTKQVREQKGITIKKAELDQDIARYKKTQQEILKQKEGFEDNIEVTTAVDKGYKKLQGIIDDLNDYMRVLHPAGLLDMGSGTSGKSIVGQG